MRKIYLLLVLSCIRLVAFGQATPTCSTTSASWNTASSASYGAGSISITGWSGSTLLDNTIQSAVSTSTGYLDRTSTIAAVNLRQGDTYPISVMQGTASSHQINQAWIDFNDDGTFSASEEVSGVWGWRPSIQPSPMDSTISIPISATPGLHRMRVRTIWEVNATDLGYPPAHVDPCLIQYPGISLQYWSGTCVDYKVNIISLGPWASTSPTSLSFPVTTISTYSTPQTFTLGAVYLTPGAGNLTITPPSGFQVSVDGGTTWSSSATTLAYTGSTVASASVQVRFAPTAVSTYSGNVAITGGGLTAAVNVAVSGTGANVCTGTPTPGTATVSPTAGGSTTTFTLNATGFSVSGGLTFQWQKSTDGGTTWTNITGATNYTYSFTGITAPTSFKLNVTCSATGLTAPTNVVSTVWYSASSCIPTWLYASSVCSNGMGLGTSAYPLIINGSGGTAIYDPSACASYTDNSSSTSLTALFWPGFTYSVTLGANTPWAYPMSDQIWIDFNNSGTFEPSESVGGSASWSGVQTTHTITLPTTGVVPGQFRMRVMTSYVGSTGVGYPQYPAMLPCPTTAQYYGEARDYKITIATPSTCTTPTAQPTALTFGSPGLYTVPISFTAPATAPDNYLVIATTSSVPPTPPSDNTYYTVGSSALGGKIVYFGPSTSCTASGLTAGTTYWFWVYSANAYCTPGPKYLTTSPLNGSMSTTNCSISGIKTVGPTGDYATLTAAMTALSTYGVGGPLALELQTSYNGSTETFPVVVPNLPCVSATNNITIRPQGTMTVSASYAGQLISMNGARYVTIDGRVGSTGTTKALTILNTSTAGSDVMFLNDAQYNKLKYVTFRGVTTSTSSAVIVFSVSPTGTVGNSYNKIDNCDILDGATTPSFGIYSYGTSGIENIYDTISNCNIANHFGTSTSAGIYVSSYSSYWTVDNNRFYHTNPYTNTSSSSRYEIYVGSGGNGFNITNNVIGYASPTATGVFSITTTTTYPYLYAMYLYVGTGVPTSVQGNTIGGITSTCTGSYYGYFYGMYLSSGAFNVGDISPNTIGSTTSANSIVLNQGSGSTPAMYALYASGSTGAVLNIKNNNIGGITTTALGTVGSSIYGMYISSSANATITGNTIGSNTVPNSIYASATSSASSQVVYGMYASISSSALINPVISGNTIANITNNCTYTSGGQTFGIYFPSSSLMTISNNSIHDISTASGYATASTVSGAGIIVSASTNPTNITQNTIYAIKNTNTTTTATQVAGIFYTGAVNGSITRNKIYDIRNASTGTTVTAPPVAAGIMLYIPNTSITIVNNMISLGNSQTTNTSFTGIMQTSNSAYSLKAYYNSINIEGTATSGALNSCAFKRGNYSATSYSSITVDARDNIFVNNRGGGTGKHYAISNDGTTSSATGWAANASNYNLLQTANTATLGYWSGDRTFATWKTASSSDANSYNSSVTFTNTATGDLHINMGTTANDIESHGIVITGINNDYDNDTRPGPTGSVNGGGIAPDLGADEFDGVPNDNLPPTITYTALLGACGTGDRTVTATISDFSGVPTTSLNRPMIYYKRTTDGTWNSRYGTLTSGTYLSGTWNFTIAAADMSGLAVGQTVQYFIIAQDTLGQVGSIPSAGLVASNVASVTTAPTSPYTYNVLVTLSGTKTVGTGGDYATITAAVADYNAGCLTGPVIFSLISPAYASETFPIQLNANPFANNTNTLTIRPAAGTAVNVNGPATTNSIFKFLNAAYITIDGVNSGGSSLTLTSTYTSTFANIWLASTTSTGPGCKKIAIKNTNLVGGSNTATSYGILAGVDNGSTPTTTAGMDNDSITIQGNTFRQLYYGIYATGTAFNLNGGINDWTISGNTFGPATYSVTDNIYYRGIYLNNAIRTNITNNIMRNIGITTYGSSVVAIYANSNCDTLNISQNDINNVTSSYGYYSSPTCAVYFGTNVLNGTITRNTIHDIYCLANSTYYAGTGISINTSTSSSNLLIANNMISNIYGMNYYSYSYWPSGITLYGSTGGVKIYYNSINLYGTFAGYTSGNTGSMCILNTTTGTNIDIRNNILSNTYHNTNNAGDKGYAIYSTSPASTFSNIDYNDYNVDGTNVLGYINSADKTTMAQMQTGFGGDTHSQSVPPLFVSPTDLHLQVVAANVPLLGSATPLTSVVVDYNNSGRSGTAPVQGCHEVVIPPCNTVTLTAGTPTPVTNVFCNSGSTSINGIGATGAVGITYQWKTSSDSTTWTNVVGATNNNYAPPGNITATTFYRLKIGCTITGMFDSATTKVTINPNPVAITGGTAVCVGLTTSLTDGSFGGTWSSSTPAKATIDPTFGVVTGVAPGTTLISYVLPTTCQTVMTMNVLSQPAVPIVSSTPAQVCNNSIASLAVVPVTPVNIVNGWEAGVPVTPGTLVGGWNTNASNTGYITQASTGSYPSATSHSGTYFADFHSWSYSGIQAALISPSFSLTNKTNPKISFWVYRDGGYNDASHTNEGWQIWINTTSSMTGATQLGFVPRCSSCATPSPNVTGTYTVTTAGWYQYSVDIPLSFSGSTNYVLFNGVSQYGNDCYLDDVSITAGAPAPPTWASTTDLYKDVAATLPYVAGDTTNTVYFHPTTYTTSTPVTYTATMSNGTCATSGNLTVTVNPQPAVIAGTHNVCVGLAGTLTDATPGGTWSSSTPAVASVGSATGAVSGLTVGNATITYTLSSTGCTKRHQVTINPLPANITGTAAACVGATTALADATAGGTWSSGTTAIASVDPVSGVVSGVSAGLAIITYTSPVGCIKTVESTINPLPSTTITPATVATACQGDATPFTANAPSPSFSILFQDFNSGLGTWTVTSPSGDPASKWMVTSTPASGITGDGTPMLESDAEYSTPTETILTSPSFSTLGYGSATVSFNQYLISLATSDALVDVEYSTDGGSTWGTVLSQVGVVDGSGVWTSTSTPEVTATLPSGALGQASVKLRWHYNSNWGLYWDIDNIRVTAYQPPVTYAWSGVGGAAGLSCAACGTTSITPTATGANVYSVVSTTSSGCQSTNSVTVNVNPLPSAISGTMQVCVNSTVTMTDADAGGNWGSADATVSVDPSAGTVTGVSAGTATVTYTLPTGCRNTVVVTVNPLPSASTGVMQVCEGLTTTLSNGTGGGSWSSSFPAVASVDAAGVVTGNVAGAADIYYTLAATGCQIAANVIVNPTPQAIDGSLLVCEGSTTSLTDADPSGTWTSGTTSVATVDVTSGVVSGVVAGASTITYQLPTGCINTATVTVNAVPAAITGTKVVCQDLTTTLANATTGGTWSTTSTDASVDAAGVVTGVNAGVATITYQLATSCVSTADVTVNPTPATIGGTPQVCIGLTTALSDTDPSGTWTSGSTGIATVDVTTGVVTGVVTGTSTITYKLPTGCINTVNVTVNPVASPITGVLKVCEGMTTTLANTDPGGLWSSSSVAVATVDASGIVTGNGSGVTTITYTLPTGCINTADVTVNPVPSAIAGASQVCEGLTTALFNGTGGGSWSSTNPTAAAIDASGTVTGYAAGNTTISYTLSATGCVSTFNMTVNPIPAAITGTKQVCEAGTTNLGDPTTGGSWSASASTASVNASGVVSGISAGIAPITYMLATGCKTVANVTVNPLPATITGTMTVCEGANTNLYNTSAGGAWTSGATGTATVASATGVVSGVAAGNAPITYTLPTGCKISTDVTVNPIPAAITGTQIVCAGQTTGLSNATLGGTWSSSLPLVASVDASGVVTGANMGNTTIIYTLPTSCKATAVVTVNPLPAPIAGTAQVCAGSTGTLTNGSASGTWSSSMPVVATISSTGSVNAIASGTTLITYTLPTGCIRTRALTVNPVPAAITGTMQLCQSATSTLNNITAGGVWSSSAVTVANISSTGVVTGGLAGTTTITYMLPTGCKATDVVTVNQLPSAIAGTPNACEGATTSLSNTVAGGSWSSAATVIATIDGTTGVMTGVMAGSTTISYQLPTGCMATRNIIVNPQPAAIAGASQVCQGSSAAMSNPVPGGVWSSSNTVVASVGLTSGTLNGLAAGPVNVTYTLMTGCAISKAIVVNPLPEVISGSLNVCNGQATALSSATTGGTWSSSNPSVAYIGSTGTVSGVMPGNATVTYALATGCNRTSIVTVNALPTVYNVSGGGNYCAGGAGVHIGVDGSNTGVNYQLYSGATPVGSVVGGTAGLPVDFGPITAAGTYSVVARNASTGCPSNMTGTAVVAVSPMVTPSVTVTTASDVVCAGTLASYTSTAVNGGTAPTYQWLVNGTPVIGATSTTYSYTPGNGDVVTNVMTSNYACATAPTATAARTMTVNANMLPAVSAIATSGINLCDGNTATFTVSSLYGGTAPTYTWMKGGSTVIGTGSTFSYVPANGDNITVKMNSNYACRLADSVTSPAVTLTTNPVYVPAMEIKSDYGFFVNENTKVTLSAVVATGGPAPTYQWYLNSSAIAGATNASYAKIFSNGDSVTCQVTGSGVCGMSTFNSIIMHVGPTSVAGTTIGNADVRLMPNPNKGEFTVKGTLSVKTDKEVAIEVTNVLGQVVYKTIVTARNGEVDARIKLDNTLANGMYMLNMIAGEDKKVFHFVLEQ